MPQTGMLAKSSVRAAGSPSLQPAGMGGDRRALRMSVPRLTPPSAKMGTRLPTAALTAGIISMACAHALAGCRLTAWHGCAFIFATPSRAGPRGRHLETLSWNVSRLLTASSICQGCRQAALARDHFGNARARTEGAPSSCRPPWLLQHTIFSAEATPGHALCRALQMRSNLRQNTCPACEEALQRAALQTPHLRIRPSTLASRALTAS